MKPTKDIRLTVWVEPHVKREIAKLAKLDDRSMSSWVNQVLRRAVVDDSLEARASIKPVPEDNF